VPTLLTGQGVSLVENIALSRQPQPHLEAVYFITPSPASVARLVADFKGGAGAGAPGAPSAQLYRKAHVFFSSPLPQAQLSIIKACAPLVAALGSLAEFNLEYFTKDSRTFVTDQPGAMEAFFGGRVGTFRSRYFAVTFSLITAGKSIVHVTNLTPRSDNPIWRRECLARVHRGV
jgi:syntaxin-binding protein 1